MNTAKKILLTVLTLAVVLSLQPLAEAAGKGGKGGKAGKAQAGGPAGSRLQEITKDLDLTDAQKEKLKPVFQAEMEKLKALRSDKSLSRQDKMAKLREVRDNLTPKLKEILTPEQYEQWQKKSAELRPDGRKRQRKTK